MVIESGGLSPNTARFTASRDPAALADRGKGGLKYLYTERDCDLVIVQQLRKELAASYLAIRRCNAQILQPLSDFE